MELHDLYTLEPRVLTFRPDNSVGQRLSYQVFESEARKFDFRILEHGGEAGAGHVQSSSVPTFAEWSPLPDCSPSHASTRPKLC